MATAVAPRVESSSAISGARDGAAQIVAKSAAVQQFAGGGAIRRNVGGKEHFAHFVAHDKVGRLQGRDPASKVITILETVTIGVII